MRCYFRALTYTLTLRNQPRRRAARPLRTVRPNPRSSEHVPPFTFHAARMRMAAPVLNQPEPGTYWTKLVKNGPRVPVLIALYGAEFSVLEAFVAGEPADLMETWERCAGRTITRAHYDYLMAKIAHAHMYEPNSPYANLRRPIDLAAAKPAL